MAKNRLLEPFYGFDSIDERMKRIPNDLNDLNYRNEYIKNHVNWFLKNHSDTIEDFYQEVSKQYPVKKEIKTGTRVLV